MAVGDGGAPRVATVAPSQAVVSSPTLARELRDVP
jgi:hypothetical protein